MSDTLYWRRVRNLLWRISDERLFVVALDIVQDSNASEPARLTALDHLTLHANAGFLTLDSWTVAPRFGGPLAFGACTRGVLTDGPEKDPRWTPPAGDPRARVVQALDTLLDDPSLPRVLRAYIECVNTRFVTVPRFARVGVLSVRYDCDNTFILTAQAAPQPYRIGFELTGDSTRKTMLVGAQQFALLELSSPRELVLTSGPRVSIRVPHGGQSCGARRYRERGQLIPAGVDTLAEWARPVRK